MRFLDYCSSIMMESLFQAVVACLFHQPHARRGATDMDMVEINDYCTLKSLISSVFLGHRHAPFSAQQYQMPINLIYQITSLSH